MPLWQMRRTYEAISRGEKHYTWLRKIHYLDDDRTCHEELDLVPRFGDVQRGNRTPDLPVIGAPGFILITRICRPLRVDASED